MMHTKSFMPNCLSCRANAHKYSIYFRWFETKQSTGQFHILWFLVAFGGLFHRSLFTSIWGISRISSPILIIISFMGEIFFTSFNIQTKVHWFTLHFFPAVLSRSKQSTTSWTDFGLACRSVYSEPSWFVNPIVGLTGMLRSLEACHDSRHSNQYLNAHPKHDLIGWMLKVTVTAIWAAQVSKRSSVLKGSQRIIA